MKCERKFLFFIHHLSCLCFQGPDQTMSLDGHDKLSGWQQKEFPIHIYGAEDTYSGRIHFLKVWTTHKNPKIIAKFYYEYLRECKGE